MVYRLDPQRSIREGVRRAATSQIEEVLAEYGNAPATGKGIHETRKAIKRLRALLTLVRHGVAPDALRKERARLREIAHGLAGARDAQVMRETAAKLAEANMPEPCRGISRTLLALLDGAEGAGALARQTAFATSGDGATGLDPSPQRSNGSGAARQTESATLQDHARGKTPDAQTWAGANPPADTDGGREKHRALQGLPVAQLTAVREGLSQLPLNRLSFDDVLRGLKDAYARGRKLRDDVFRGEAEDEAFHELRKAVQQHWRHLQLLCDAWPKAIRAHVNLARELSETLGEDHDIAVLADFVRRQSDRLGPQAEVRAYLALCTRRQEALRQHGHLLARRLYAEKPKALCARIAVYWQTVEGFAEGKPALGRAQVPVEA